MKGDLFERPEFQCIGKEKIELLKEMAALAKGKTPAELMGLFIKYKDRLAGGYPLSEREKAALLLALRESLEEGEKQQFDRTMEFMRFIEK